MSVLTKVFVVLLTLLSISLSMFVIAAFSQQEKWKDSAEDWRAAALAEQAKYRTLAYNSALEQQQALDRHQQDLAEISAVRSDLADRERKISQLERNYEEEQNKVSAEQGQVTSVQSHNALLLAALNSEKQFAANLSKRNALLERQNVDLNDRVKELTATVAMAKSRVRALKEQISGMSELHASATQIPGGPDVVQPYTPSVSTPRLTASVTSPIRAEVTSVRNGLAEISVGSTDGVAHGMKFLLYRRSGSTPQYLGTLKVTRVEAVKSAGIIEQAEGEVRPGDSARDEASFALRG